MSKTKATSGFRIRYEKHDNGELVSVRYFSDGEKMVRLVVDPAKMTWQIRDAVTGNVYEIGEQGWTNLEVVYRNAKKAIRKFLKLEFSKEYRKAGQFAHLTPPNKPNG